MSRFYLDENDIPKIQKLLDQGLSTGVIAERLGFGRAAITDFIRRNNLKGDV